MILAVEPDPVVAVAPAVAEVAPIVVEPVSAPAVVDAVVAPTEAPAVEPVVEAQPEFKPHTDIPTILEQAGKKPEDEKPVEVKPDEKPVIAPTKPVEPVAEPVVVEPAAPADYSTLKLSEGLVADPEKMGAYTGLLAEHKIAPEVGQKLIDLHATAMQSFADQTLANQHKAFAETRKDWVKKAMADEEFGGSGFNTSVAAVARARDLLISSAKPGTPKYAQDVKDFNEFIAWTGAGDHPAFLRVLHNAARMFDEPAMPPTGIRPPPNNGQKPGRKGMRSLYNNDANGAA